MELTLASALSTGGLLGHLSYLLLVLSMLSRSMIVLRLVVIASAVPALAYHFFWLTNPVGVFWESLLVAVNVVQLARIVLSDRLARFTGDERTLLTDHLAMPLGGAARRMLDTGEWVDLPDGAELARDGARPDHLNYIAKGEVEITRHGATLAICGPGNFVGEMAVLEPDGVAAATATAVGPIRVWRMEYATFDQLSRSQPEAAGALRAAIARDLRLKIISDNAERSGIYLGT